MNLKQNSKQSFTICWYIYEQASDSNAFAYEHMQMHIIAYFKDFETINTYSRHS